MSQSSFLRLDSFISISIQPRKISSFFSNSVLLLIKFNLILIHRIIAFNDSHICDWFRIRRFKFLFNSSSCVGAISGGSIWWVISWIMWDAAQGICEGQRRGCINLWIRRCAAKNWVSFGEREIEGICVVCTF